MSVFDLFRAFFGVPADHHRGQRDLFFDAMVHEDDEDEEDEDGYGVTGGHMDPFDSAWRFGLRFGPQGMEVQEPPVIGQILRELERFSMQGLLDGAPDSGPPSSITPPQEDGVKKPPGGSSGNPLRDFMLKPPGEDRPCARSDPPHYPFSKFRSIWREGPVQPHSRGDRDPDSGFSSGGLDQIPGQPRPHSFFQSVRVTKVLKPDGSVEERRTVRDGQGNEKTTVTRSDGTPEGSNRRPVPDLPGVLWRF